MHARGGLGGAGGCRSCGVALAAGAWQVRCACPINQAYSLFWLPVISADVFIPLATLGQVFEL